MNQQDLLRERKERDQFLAEHYASPLPEEEQELFEGLDYFEIDPEWRIKVTFEEEVATRTAIPSTSGTDSPYTRLGTVTMELGGATHVLGVFDDGDGTAFVPFRDGTAGRECYGGGRYVDLEVEPGGSTFLDFNRARNPWCVYDDDFVCPLPPPENWMEIPIPAGEKAFVPKAQKRP